MAQTKPRLPWSSLCCSRIQPRVIQGRNGRCGQSEAVDFMARSNQSKTRHSEFEWPILSISSILILHQYFNWGQSGNGVQKTSILVCWDLSVVGSLIVECKSAVNDSRMESLIIRSTHVSGCCRAVFGAVLPKDYITMSYILCWIYNLIIRTGRFACCPLDFPSP